MAQVRFQKAATTFVLDVGNISRSGLFVRTSSAAHLGSIRLGEELDLDVFVSEELRNIHVRARVVRIVGEGEPHQWGFGVNFAALSSETDAAVAHLVELAAEGRLRPPPLPAQPPFVFLPADEPEKPGGGKKGPGPVRGG